MTPEKFRQWIVIIFAALLVTMWLGMGLKICKYSKYGMMKKQCSMAKQKCPKCGTMDKK